MKRTLTLLMSLAAGGYISAQPVITSSSVFPVTGTADSIYATAATVAPGAGGAAVTWNFSALSLTLGGTATVVTPSSTPYASSFPSANFSIQLTTGSTAYNYVNNSSSGWNTIATSYSGVSTGQDYSPDNRLEIPFPFHYTDSVTDTYQETSGSSQTESVIYDGYGTLVTPLHTYTNVIRVKKNYGSDYHYQWYTVSPLYLIMDYSSSGNNYIYISERPATTTAIGSANTNTATAQLSPNPLSNNGTLRINTAAGIRNASIIITDAMGRIVKQVAVTTTETIITRDGLSPGFYFYKVYNNDVKIANGKLLIQ